MGKCREEGYHLRVYNIAMVYKLIIIFDYINLSINDRQVPSEHSYINRPRIKEIIECLGNNNL